MNALLPAITVKRIDLSHALPLCGSDPGGFNYELIAGFHAIEVTVEDATSEPVGFANDLAVEHGVDFVLMSGVATPVLQSQESVVYRQLQHCGLAIFRSDLKAAIASCLQVRRRRLTENFGW